MAEVNIYNYWSRRSKKGRTLFARMMNSEPLERLILILYLFVLKMISDTFSCGAFDIDCMMMNCELVGLLISNLEDLKKEGTLFVLMITSEPFSCGEFDRRSKKRKRLCLL